MKYIDLQKQYCLFKKDIRSAIDRVLESGEFILGREVSNLENKIAKWCGSEYAIAVNSGTDALLLSLMSIGIGPGDEVITTPFTFIATAEVIALLNAKPVFVDIDTRTFNINPDELEHSITEKTKAIIVVHLYGQAADLDPILKIAHKHKIQVIEDAAQAFGAEYNDKRVGSFGTTGCFSFFPAKNLGAYGDGGMVVTNKKTIAREIILRRQHGADKRYHHVKLGVNSRLDAIQAAILLVKFKYIDQWNNKRRQLAKRYNKVFVNMADIQIPYVLSKSKHVYNQYTLQCKRRDELKKYLDDNKIPTSIHYPTPLHLQPVFSYLKYKKGDFPNTEYVSKKVLSLPLYPEMSEILQDIITKKIVKFYD